jgi:gluconolactonase
VAWTFTQVIGPFGLTEGPAWDGTALLFTDGRNQRIRRYDPATGRVDIHREGAPGVNGLMFDRQGRLYGCEGAGRRVVRYDRGGASVVAERLDGKRLNSPNDLAIDRHGRIWFTDPRYGDQRDDMELDHESVLRATERPDGSWAVVRVTFDTTRPNGLLLSADERWLYVAQSSYALATERRELRAYPIADDGSAGRYEVLHDFGPHRGIDGMCLDRDGNIVATAGWEVSGPGGMIYVFAPNGRVLATHPLPAPVKRPTNCTFGGPRLSTLNVTSIEGYLHCAETELVGRPAWWPA